MFLSGWTTYYALGALVLFAFWVGRAIQTREMREQEEIIEFEKELKMHQEYEDYCAQERIEGREPISKKEWRRRVERFTYGADDRLIAETENE